MVLLEPLRPPRYVDYLLKPQLFEPVKTLSSLVDIY